MKIQTVLRTGTGWSHPLASALDSASTVVFAFGAPAFGRDDAPFADLRTAFPKSHILGCSTAGEIHGSAIVDEAISVVVARFDRTPIRSAVQRVTLSTSFEAGAALAREVAGDDLAGCFVLSSGHDVNGSALADGLRSVLGETPTSGGLAGDGTRFGETWVVADGRAQPGFVSIVAFYGDSISLGHGSKGGWDKFGPERRVTRARGNVLYELDGRPALDVYKSYLGELASGLPSTALLFPLSIRASRTSTDPLVRTVLAHDENEKSLTFAGDMPEGSYAQLMRANFDRLVDAASDAASVAKLDSASLCLAVSCVGRRLVLGERAEEETEAVGDMLPGCAVAGFYSYGEIAPTGFTPCGLHNQTMTLTTFSEV